MRAFMNSPPELYASSLLLGASLGWLASPALLRFVQPFQHGGYDDGQSDSCVDKNFAEFSALGRRNEFTPGNRLTIRTAGQSAPIDGLGTDSQSIVVAL